MANVANGNLVYAALNGGLMTQAPLFGEVIDVAGAFTASVAVQAENGGLLLFHSLDTDVNKLVIYTEDGSAAGTLAGSRWQTTAYGLGRVLVLRSILIGGTRYALVFSNMRPTSYANSVADNGHPFFAVVPASDLQSV